MPITFKYDNKFNKTDNYLKKLRNLKMNGVLDKFGQMGVNELKNNTPKIRVIPLIHGIMKLSITRMD